MLVVRDGGIVKAQYLEKRHLLLNVEALGTVRVHKARRSPLNLQQLCCREELARAYADSTVQCTIGGTSTRPFASFRIWKTPIPSIGLRGLGIRKWNAPKSSLSLRISASAQHSTGTPEGAPLFLPRPPCPSAWALFNAQTDSLRCLCRSWICLSRSASRFFASMRATSGCTSLFWLAFARAGGRAPSAPPAPLNW
eukprot:CAMPEP_0169428792 /NCGR_PEP_ID=MMETSP1042-20121227/1518_1 /TAXON_ID=464988 /ORGANISM="Hemiselmis andersenii, Strain CCMP1180" /LENGTH=195 /DNA_ID=CAMNT_0009538991 /DNA_START=663 /DNA_END=1251 /DNA_ORIENTATION=+